MRILIKCTEFLFFHKVLAICGKIIYNIYVKEVSSVKVVGKAKIFMREYFQIYYNNFTMLSCDCVFNIPI